MCFCSLFLTPDTPVPDCSLAGMRGRAAATGESKSCCNIRTASTCNTASLGVDSCRCHVHEGGHKQANEQGRQPVAGFPDTSFHAASVASPPPSHPYVSCPPVRSRTNLPSQSALETGRAQPHDPGVSAATPTPAARGQRDVGSQKWVMAEHGSEGAPTEQVLSAYSLNLLLGAPSITPSRRFRE